MMLWFAIAALAFIYIVNTVLAFLQTKNYTSAFTTHSVSVSRYIRSVSP